MERMLLSSREPPITPAAAAAAVPRNEPPGAIGAPIGAAGIGCVAWVCQADDIGVDVGAASPGRTEGTDPRPSRLPKKLSRTPPRKLVSGGAVSADDPLSSSRMRASARL